MWQDRRLMDLLGIEHPIIQAPMASASTPAMAAAAANAGCLGSLGCAFMSPGAYAQAFDETRKGTNRRLNMNFFCHAEPRLDPAKAEDAKRLLQPLFDDMNAGPVPDVVPTNFPYGAEIHAAVMASRPGVVSFHFGLPDLGFVAELKDVGTVILCTATTAQEARDLEARGVDAVIAQGWEAGGHHGFYLTDKSAQIGTMALVPEIVDAVSVPVIAAGGIADGRGIVAALALGAAGVQIGTAFLSTTEAGIAPAHKRALADAGGSDTRPTRAFSGRPARGIVNRYMRETEAMEDKLPDFPLMNTVTAPLRKASTQADSGDHLALWAGQAVGLSRDVPVEALVDALVEEARAILANLVNGA